MLSVMKTQKTESHKDDRNRGHCTCSNGKVESQCEWQARKNGRRNSRARWEGAPHEGGVVISVRRIHQPLLMKSTLDGCKGPVRCHRPRWTQRARNLRNHFKSCVYFYIGKFIFLLLKGQNLKKNPSKCFTICMVCKYFLKSMTSSWFNSQAQKVRQEMRPTYLLLQVVHAVSGSRL